jgi:hypothetical protein
MSKLTEYTVHFRTDIDSAVEEITARSPQEALAQARTIAGDERHNDLFFEPYTGRFHVNEITVETHDGKQVAEWLDEPLGRTETRRRRPRQMARQGNRAPGLLVARLACLAQGPRPHRRIRHAWSV